MIQNKALSLLGLATKAGKTVSAGDSSDNTKKKFRNMCAYYQVPLFILKEDKEMLGKAMGKEFRASAAVQDENFANALIKKLADSGVFPEEA